MSTTAIDAEVRSYLAAVRMHLRDLPEQERDDLLEDLEQHLSEVIAEDDGSLADRLGPPDVYAAELLASVGLASVPTSRLKRILDSVDPMSAINSLRAFVPELRPGWWVLRGVITAAAPNMLIGTQDLAEYLDPLNKRTLVIIASGLVAIPLSILLGRRSTAGRSGAQALSIAANVAVLALALITLAAVRNMYYVSLQEEADNQNYLSSTWLTHPDGSPIANICAYTLDGKRLDNVVLFDQQGRPIVDVAPFGGPNSEEVAGRVFPRDEQGRRIRNAYPQKVMVPDPATGELNQLRCPSSVAAGNEEDPPLQESEPPPAVQPGFEQVPNP